MKNLLNLILGNFVKNIRKILKHLVKQSPVAQCLVIYLT